MLSVRAAKRWRGTDGHQHRPRQKPSRRQLLPHKMCEKVLTGVKQGAISSR